MVDILDLHPNDIIRRSHVSVGGQLHLRTKEYSEENPNTFKAKATEVGDSATFIEMPEGVNSVVLYHVESGETVYLGSDDSVTVGAEDAAALTEAPFNISVNIRDDNTNNIYGIVSSGTTTVYAIGMATE